MAPATAQAVSDQLASVIKGHVDHIMSQKDAASSEPDPGRLSVAEVKEQIMANLEILWPMLKAREISSEVFSRNKCNPYGITLRDMTKHHLVTVAAGNKISARIVCGGQPPYQEAFINGPEASCHRTAYEKLLEMLDTKLQEKWGTFVETPEDVAVVEDGMGGCSFENNNV